MPPPSSTISSLTKKAPDEPDQRAGDGGAQVLSSLRRRTEAQYPFLCPLRGPGGGDGRPGCAAGGWRPCAAGGWRPGCAAGGWRPCAASSSAGSYLLPGPARVPTGSGARSPAAVRASPDRRGSPVAPGRPAHRTGGAGAGANSWFSRLPVLAKLAALFGALVLIGGVSRRLLPSPPTCTFSCMAISGPLQPAGKSFSQPAFLLPVPEPADLVTPSQVGAVVTLNDSNGGPAWIWAGQGEESRQG